MSDSKTTVQELGAVPQAERGDYGELLGGSLDYNEADPAKSVLTLRIRIAPRLKVPYGKRAGRMMISLANVSCVKAIPVFAAKGPWQIPGGQIRFTVNAESAEAWTPDTPVRAKMLQDGLQAALRRASKASKLAETLAGLNGDMGSKPSGAF